MSSGPSSPAPPEHRPLVVSEEVHEAAPPILDMIAAAALVALSLWVMVEAFRLPQPGDWTTAPGLLPFAVGASLGLMSLALGWHALKRRGGDSSSLGAALPSAWLRTLGLFLIIGIYLLGLELVPFEQTFSLGGFRYGFGSFEVFSIVTLTVLLVMNWRAPIWACLLVSVIWIAALAAAFRLLFRIPLPS